MTCPQEEEHHLRIGSGTGQVLFGNRSAMRFASEDELLAAHAGPHYAVAEDQARGARSSVDVRPLGRLLRYKTCKCCDKKRKHHNLACLRMTDVPNLLISGVRSNWWGLSCPAHYFSSSVPALLLTFSLGLSFGIILGFALCAWIFGFRPQLPFQPAPWDSPPRYDEVCLGLSFQGLQISVRGPAGKALSFIQKITKDPQHSRLVNQLLRLSLCLLALQACWPFQQVILLSSDVGQSKVLWEWTSQSLTLTFPTSTTWWQSALGLRAQGLSETQWISRDFWEESFRHSLWVTASPQRQRREFT